MQTKIRLLPKVQYDYYSRFIFWMHFSMVTGHCSNFRVITTIFSGVKFFSKKIYGKLMSSPPEFEKSVILSLCSESLFQFCNLLLQLLQFHSICHCIACSLNKLKSTVITSQPDKYLNDPMFPDRQVWANTVDPDQTGPLGAA